VEEYDRVDWTRPSVLIVGNEGAGLSEEVREGLREGGREGGREGMREGQVRAACIPLVGGIESLNAAAAGAIIMSEVARQRRRRAGGRAGDVK
jgi:TrmH family RNA methyltransferase